MDLPPPTHFREILLEEAELLYALVKSIKAKNIVEIGTFRGYSAHIMSLAGAKVTSYDITDHKPRFEGFTVKRGSSVDVTETDIDAAYIDGNHRYESTKQDFEKLWPRIRAGGLIIIHDVNPYADFSVGPTKFMDELIAKGYECIRIPTYRGLGVVKKK